MNSDIFNDLRSRYEMFGVKNNAAIGIFGMENYLKHGRGVVSFEVQTTGQCTHSYLTSPRNEEATKMMHDYNPDSAVVLMFTCGQSVISYCVDIFALGSESYTPVLPDFI